VELEDGRIARPPRALAQWIILAAGLVDCHVAIRLHRLGLALETRTRENYAYGRS
jgi:hypothetical protein